MAAREAGSVFAPGAAPNTVRAADGSDRAPPEGWALLPPGDPGATRRVKAAGDHWVVQERRGRKLFSRGVWAPAATIEKALAELAAERADPKHARKQETAALRRARDQAAYVEDFLGAVRSYLAFAPLYADLAERLAKAVTEHATPVGSGTVARTERIPLADRAAAAVIAWLRHQTTAYDHMAIRRVKGERREVRRRLAAKSKELLARYRDGTAIPDDCPLRRALRELA